MPRLDLMLLPLLGGYVFLITFNLTKYSHKRIEKNRLLYDSLLVAFILLSIVYILDYTCIKYNGYAFKIGCNQMEPVNYYRSYVSTVIQDITIFNSYGFKQSLFAFLIAYPMAILLNKVKYFNENFSFDYAVNKYGTEFEKIIWEALGEHQDIDKLLMITTKGGKVYIGHIIKFSEPIGNAYIKIIPTFSGYRSKEDHNLVITTDYTKIITDAVENGEMAKRLTKIGVVVPMSEIMFISRFDIQVFGQFNPDDNTPNPG